MTKEIYTPNVHIQCGVRSCAHHCKDKEFCTLAGIRVEPCKGARSGSADEESFCGSYHPM